MCTRCREELRLVEELGRLEAGQSAAELGDIDIAHLEQHRERDVGADHRGALEQPLQVVGQPVGAGREDRLDRRRDPHRVHSLGQAMPTSVAQEGLRFPERPDRLLDEERVAIRASGHECP
jgi:hypothetical protein